MSNKSDRKRRKIGRFLQKKLKKVGYRIKKQHPVDSEQMAKNDRLKLETHH
ncbi:hypothetical protein P4361_19285 [Fictibacillus sp. B-59209]|uniref:hypothetical protein n=1 Tax=Fictibacillus sp. B-59209 TaxID=3024873 RepID=UPI002E20CFF5|nr:hypothetical protein [Fictibacillus sp. B-59209]